MSIGVNQMEIWGNYWLVGLGVEEDSVSAVETIIFGGADVMVGS